jgi:hypothetical protein
LYIICEASLVFGCYHPHEESTNVQSLHSPQFRCNFLPLNTEITFDDQCYINGNIDGNMKFQEATSACPRTQSPKRPEERLNSLEFEDGIHCPQESFLCIEVVGTLKRPLSKNDLSRDGEMEFWHVL